MLKRNKDNNINLSKKIVIIGGGLSGLVTGIYLLNRGADVTIVEKNNTLGGKINYLINENYPFTIYNKSQFLNVLGELKISNTYLLEHKINNLSEKFETFITDLYNKSLDDNKKIDEFIDQINKKTTAKKYHNITIEDYLKGFNSVEIRNNLSIILPTNLSISCLIDYLRLYYNDEICTLDSTFISELKHKYIELNGKLLLNNEVKNFTFDRKNRASNIVLNNKTKIEADYFISTIDPYVTLHLLLKDKFKHLISIIYKDYMTKIFDTRIVLLFAINKTFEYNNINVFVDELRINTSKVNFITFKKSLDKNFIYCEIIQNYNDYDYLKILVTKPKLYQENQHKIIKEVINIFNDNFNNYKIHFKEMITPLDIENKYYNYRGMYSGFLQTPTNPGLLFDSNIKSLKNVILSSPVLLFNGDITSSLLLSKKNVEVLQEAIKNEKKEEV